MVVAHLTSRFSFPNLGLVLYIPLFLCLFLPHLPLWDLLDFLGVSNLKWLGVLDCWEPTILALALWPSARGILDFSPAARCSFLGILPVDLDSFQTFGYRGFCNPSLDVQTDHSWYI